MIAGVIRRTWLLMLAGALAQAAVPADPAGWQTLYREDFERGDLSGWKGSSADHFQHFQVVREGNNSVLAGEAHAKLILADGFWRDYRFKARVKMVDQTIISLGFRDTQCGNYAVSFAPGHVELERQLGCYDSTRLASRGEAHEIGRWYTLEVVGRGASIQVYLDGSLKLEVTDANPVLGGGISVFVAQSGHALFDDLEVVGPPDTSSLLWVRTGGPHGGVGYDIRMRPDNPDYLMVTDVSSGVSLSTDGGKTWKPSNQGILSRAGNSGDAIPIFCLTIDPNAPDTVWAGTQNMRGIYKSVDGGKTWAQKDHGVVEQNGITFRGFAVDPRNSKTVYAAAEIDSSVWAGAQRTGRSFVLVKGVVYKTTDGGENWTAIWRGDNLARYIWIDPRDSNVLYVSTGIFDREAANSDAIRNIPGGVGVLKSKDGGRTWRVLNEANGLKNLYVGSLFMHPTNPDILLAATGNGSWPNEQGTYLSTDGGETWKRVQPDRRSGPAGSGDQMNAVEFAPSNPNIAYSVGPGFYRSEDGGRTWRRMSRPEDNVWGVPGVSAGTPMDLQVDPRNADRVFVNSYTGGNFLTEDGGKTFELASRGYTGAILRDVVADPADAGRVFAIGRGGFHRSDNAGLDWIPQNYVPLNVAEYFKVWGLPTEWIRAAVDPRDTRNVIVANELEGTLQRSSDGGMTWRLVYRHPSVVQGSPETNQGFRALAFSTAQPDVVYAGMSNPSIDKGTDAPSFGVFKSLDGGRTWREANDANSAKQNIHALAVDPRTPSTVYAGTYRGGILRTLDGGGKWEPVNNGLRVLDVRSIAIDPSNPSVLYAGAEKGGVYKSTNGGTSWQPMSAGMDPGAAVRDIVIDPTNTQVIYAADMLQGVFRSEDGGKLWVQVIRGLTMRTVAALSLTADGGTLYAATDGGGVFRLDLKARTDGALAALPAASFVKDGPVAPESIVSLYGVGLAAALQQAGADALPEALGETKVSVTDSEGHDFWAQLYFVSPGQINFLVPASAKTGAAPVRVFRQNKVIARGAVQVDPVAPGLFTASANGQGVPAALAARYGEGGAQTAVQVFQCSATCSPVAMDLGAEGDQLILSLYGTGLRAARVVTATLGGVDAPVLGFAAQSQYAGLDQVNVRVPRDLKGRGDVDLLLKADGKAANSVQVRIQ